VSSRGASRPAPVRIESIDDEPVAELHYLNASRRGGTEVCRLRIERARASGLPDGLDALVATSDLQGIVPSPRGGEATLLGVAVADLLDELAFDGMLPPAQRCGALLAGDLYSVPEANRRGGHGDVAAVWHAFADLFAWVVGVAGNHDDVAGVATGATVHALDGETVLCDGLRIGGVGLIAGNPLKTGRRAPDEQLARIDLVAGEDIDILLLHEGPCGDGEQPGSAAIRESVEAGCVPLTVCGHVHWARPVAEHAGGQILNVDTRVIVIAST
jgi:3',5'-cyclic-AMP phosphodiesterase